MLKAKTEWKTKVEVEDRSYHLLAYNNITCYYCLLNEDLDNNYNNYY